jgi:hypothetical protein
MNMIRNIHTVVFQPTGATMPKASKAFNLILQGSSLVGGPFNIPVSKIKRGGIKLDGNGTAVITLKDAA